MISLLFAFLISFCTVIAITFRPRFLSLSTLSMSHSINEQQIASPPEKFLAHDYVPTGRQLKLKDDTELYASGSAQAKKGVILLPDTMGWNAGRIRSIADFLGENECLAVVPALLGTSKEAEGGTAISTSYLHHREPFIFY